MVLHEFLVLGQNASNAPLEQWRHSVWPLRLSDQPSLLLELKASREKLCPHPRLQWNASPKWSAGRRRRNRRELFHSLIQGGIHFGLASQPINFSWDSSTRLSTVATRSTPRMLYIWACIPTINPHPIGCPSISCGTPAGKFWIRLRTSFEKSEIFSRINNSIERSGWQPQSFRSTPQARASYSSDPVNRA